MRYKIITFTMILSYAMNLLAQVKTTDSIFIRHSRPIKFIVNKTDISKRDRIWIIDTLIPELQALKDQGIIIGRAAASPEGPTPNNQRLARQRCARMNALLGQYGISKDLIHYDVVTEDYPLLHSLMRLENDAEFAVVDSLMKRYSGKTQLLKEAMKQYQGGTFWRRILRDYFPQLRAVRLMAIDKRLRQPDSLPQLLPDISVSILPPYKVEFPIGKLHVDIGYQPTSMQEARRELLSVKTNLLFDFAYMPGYERFCPIPNVALEYYPLHGHFTYGASFDGPWWQHYRSHKYFQVRNYQLHARYYLRSGDIGNCPPGMGAAFKGLFVSAYAHAGLYNICFAERRGWEGEGVGGGLGIGYVVPLSRKEHWRLEFGLQMGYFYTRYDPYQWRCPVDPDTDTELYYYKWYGNAKDFRKRQHRYTWLGPTRAEVTLSYDILYRRLHKKGASFRSHE